MMYNNSSSVLPNLLIEQCILTDKKCNNKCIGSFLKAKMFHDYNRRVTRLGSDSVTSSTLDKAHSKFIKWPVLPKVKETHFKIINKIYLVAELLQKRFGFEVDKCSFCSDEDETLEHLLFLCPTTQRFWCDIKDWISLKIKDVPPFELYNIIFYMDHLTMSVSDIINIIILLGKYHIHCAKWRNSKPSFSCFINEFRLFFSSLNMIKNKYTKKLSLDFSRLLLF